MSLRLLLLSCLLSACSETAEILVPPDGGVGDSGVVPPQNVDLGAGQDHALVIRDGALYGFGLNDRAQLGLGGPSGPTFPATRVGQEARWIQAVAGSVSACALDADRALWCAGGNDNGQLGVGDTNPRSALATVAGRYASVALRFDHGCAIGLDASLWCWGSNAEGNLGQDDGGRIVGDTPQPIAVAVGRSFAQVSSGQGHTCAIETSGALWCWGRNSDGELGLGPGQDGQIRAPRAVAPGRSWRAVSAGQNSSCGIDAEGKLYCWGGNDNAELGLGDLNRRDEPTQLSPDTDWISLSLNTFHGCALKADHSLYCWGRNVEGQLGLGDTDLRLRPTRVPGAADWIAVGAGRFFTCAAKDDRSIWCAGKNEQAQLGLEDLTRRSTFTRLPL